MPAFFAWVGASLFMSQIAVGLGQFLMAYATVLGTSTLLLGAAAYSNKQKKKAIAKYNASQVDRLVNVPTTVGPRELVLGRVRKGGTIIFRDSAGATKNVFTMIIALAGHEIDAVEQIYFNDVAVSIDSSGRITSSPYLQISLRTHSWMGVHPESSLPDVVPGSYFVYETDVSDGMRSMITVWTQYIYSYYAFVGIHLGSPDQVADPSTMSLFPGLWTASHRLRGVAYLVCTFYYNEDIFPSGLPVVTARIRGARCYDPRNGTTAWTMNPALHVRHVLTHPYFGKRTSLTAAEDARISAAANACATSYTPIGGSAGPLYYSSIVFPFGTPAVDCFDDLVQACCGLWADAGGEFFLKAGVYTAPVLSFDEDDLATTVRSADGRVESLPVIINTHKPRADKLNVIVPRIWNAGQDYKQVSLSPVKNTGAIAEDGKELAQDIEMSAVPTASLAVVVAQFILKDMGDPLMATIHFKLRAYRVELFENIELSIARYGWVDKLFMVMGKITTADGNIQLTLKETSPELTNPAAAANVDGYADNSNLVSPWLIDSLGEITADSSEDWLYVTPDGNVVTRVYVTWPEITDGRILQSGYVDISWSYGSDPLFFTTVTVAGDSPGAFIQGPKEGQTIVIIGRTRTALTTSGWSRGYYHTVVGKTSPPDTVASASVIVSDGSVVLSWAPVSNVDLAGYEARTVDSGWGTAGQVFKGNALSTPVSVHNNTWYVRAYDSSGNYSIASAVANYTFLPVPNPTGVNHLFADTALTIATITLRWVGAVGSQFPIDRYKISYNGIDETVKGSTITLPASWVGDRLFTITTVDIYGRESSGVSYVVTKLRPAPAENFRAQVVDNNVLFYWSLPEKTSLPIAHVLLKRGLEWDTATVIGTKSGEFTTVSELAGGDYVYWLATVDTDNYVTDEPVSLAVRVSQPPDFIFNASYTSDLVSGTFNSALAHAGTVLLPVVSETWQEHYVDNSFATPNAQITAGFPQYLQPATSSGYYEETFDYGTVLGSSSVTITASVTALVGTHTVVPTISVSLDNVSWTSFVGQFSTFAQNFRYIRVRITVNQVSSGAIARLSSLDVRLDTKLKTDAGVVNCLSGDTNGTIVNFNTEFIDVVAISPSVASTAARYPVYEFLDTVLSGTYALVSNVLTVSVVAHGLVVGQRVRLMPTSGALPLAVYTVASVIGADSFTVNVTAANTSGNISLYWASARFRVYDAAGARQTEIVSWTVRGS